MRPDKKKQKKVRVVPKKKRGVFTYLVLGSNNFWYGTCSTLAEAKEVADTAIISPESFDDPETGYTPDSPDGVFIYRSPGRDKYTLITASKKR